MSIFFCGNNCDLGRDRVKQLGIECFDVPYSFEGKNMSILLVRNLIMISFMNS